MADAALILLLVVVFALIFVRVASAGDGYYDVPWSSKQVMWALLMAAFWGTLFWLFVAIVAGHDPTGFGIDTPTSSGECEDFARTEVPTC